MMDLFYDAAEQIQSQAIVNWQKQGKPIVGYTCTHLPAEVLHAAGILPVRLRGIGTNRMQIGDAYFGPYICSFPKSILQLAGQGRYGFLDGVIITPGCDSMRRLHECWRKAGEDYKQIVPDFFYYFHVPHKTEPHGMAWFEAEIIQLIEAVQVHFNTRITPAKLKQAICCYNKGRRLLARMESMRAADRCTVSGTQAFAVAVAGTVMPREEYNRHLARYLDHDAGAGGRRCIEKKKRLMVLGSISDDIALIKLIEADGRALVAAENLCFGARCGGGEINENQDPVKALAQGYLGKSTCPRMYGKYGQRLAAVMQIITQANIDGVVLQNIRFCDLHGSENSLFERDLEAKNIPCLKLEREYGALVETGRIKMRLDAFFERIGA